VPLVGISKDEALAPPRLAAAIRERGITVLFLTTGLFNQIAQEEPTAFSTLRYLLFGGEAVDPHSVREVLARGGPPGRLLHVYGPTESTTYTSWHPVTAVAPGARTVPIGGPISNTEIYVLDRNLVPVPAGVPGELCIGGDGLARGYLFRPALTAEKFIPNPFRSTPQRGERLYRTGDLVRTLADGSVEFLGRLDHQVKLRGFRIELGEIEAVLAAHPAVRETVVVADQGMGGVKRLVAYAVPEPETGELGAGELRAYLGDSLPDFMVPAAFVLLDSLPRTPNGKVDRRALPAPESVAWAQAEDWVAPRGPLEEVVAGIWAQL
ncbi:MAG: AMP-binding protein, partial [bacterium]|nr:AMP-binding protein [bacterium]